MVIGVVDDIKRFDYLRPQGSYYIAQSLQANNIRSAEISIRHSPAYSTKTFRDKFRQEMGTRLRIGNFYLVSVNSYSKIADGTKDLFGVTTNIRLHTYMMGFFLLNILLCVMGTFWYRINQRPNEIGLRKAVGAGRSAIRNELLMESLFLLLLVVVPAMIIEYQFVHLGLLETIGGEGRFDPRYLPDRPMERFLVTNAITLCLTTVVVVAATWIPARRGASLEAAEALRNE